MTRTGLRMRQRGVRLSIRQATLGDIDVLIHQRRAMWIDLGVKNGVAHDKGDRVYRRWARTRMKSHQLMGWLVEDRRGRVAGGGCLRLQPVQPRPHRVAMVQPYLLSMYTEPDLRGLGIASMVVNEAIEWSRRNGYERLMLHASAMGRNVYRRLGFKRTWEMRLDLGTPLKDHSSRRRKNVAVRVASR